MCTCCAGPGPCLTAGEIEEQEIPTEWVVDCSRPRGEAVLQEMEPEKAAALERARAGHTGFQEIKRQREEKRQRGIAKLRRAAETSESARDLLDLLGLGD